MNFNLKNSSVKIPLFSDFALGLWRLDTWNMNSAQLFKYIQSSIDQGITTFDHADIYGGYSCEGIFGKAISGQSALRQKMQLVSKCGIKLISENRPDHKVKSYDTSKAHIIKSVENSLTQLQTDYLDVLLIHRPNPMMDADATAEAFQKLKDDGKVLHFGVSNFLPSQFDLLQSRLDFPLVTNQVEISVIHLDAFQNGVLDQCQQTRIKPMAWSPVAGGTLFTNTDPKTIRLREILNQTGAEIGDYSMEQIAIAWLLNHPAGIIPVLGSGKMERIQHLLEAKNIRLSTDQWLQIWSASTGMELP